MCRGGRAAFRERSCSRCAWRVPCSYTSCHFLDTGAYPELKTKASAMKVRCRSSIVARIGLQLGGGHGSMLPPEKTILSPQEQGPGSCYGVMVWTWSSPRWHVMHGRAHLSPRRGKDLRHISDGIVFQNVVRRIFGQDLPASCGAHCAGWGHTAACPGQVALIPGHR